jgi:TonB family protein
MRERYFKRERWYFDVIPKLKTAVACSLVAMALILTAVNLPAQDNRKALSNPEPPYPEVARRLRLSGVVKVQVTIAPDGKIKETKILGGHPIFVNSVEQTLKEWKYAPAASETTTQLEFSFRP